MKKYVIGPDGTPITLADLPPASVKRMVPRRKATVVHAVHGGLLRKEDAKRMYGITEAEWKEWTSKLKLYGLPGLRVTHLQDYRKPPSRSA